MGNSSKHYVMKGLILLLHSFLTTGKDFWKLYNQYYATEGTQRNIVKKEAFECSKIFGNMEPLKCHYSTSMWCDVLARV